MRSDIEIRNDAWARLWQGKWFWKLLAGTILLNVCTQVVYAVLDGVLRRLGVFNLTALQAALEASQKTGAALPEFTPAVVFQLVSSTLLLFFFLFIMAGISTYGSSVLLLRAVDGDDKSWMKAAFGGFSMPFGLAWLWLSVAFVFALWYVLAGLPCAAVLYGAYLIMPPSECTTTGATCFYALAITLALGLFLAVFCVPFYRYRYLFRLKADHPEWSAWRCMRECAALVDGFKWRCFVHDCSYWRILLALLVPIVVVFAAVAFGVAGALAAKGASGGVPVSVIVAALVGVLAYLALIPLALVAFFYVGLGQTFLYREISLGKNKTTTTTNNERNSPQ